MTDRKLTYNEAIGEALDLCMTADDRVFMMGEDIGAGADPAGVSEPLFKKFGPERIRDTPISEIAMAGAALGAALNGMKPVVWYSFSDLLPIASNQIINEIGPFAFLSGGRTPVPLVMRIQVYGFPGFGHAHSKSLWGMFLSCPGLKLVMPASAYDAKGMLIGAIEDPNPVLFFEHLELATEQGVVPEGWYTAPLYGSQIRRHGTDITIAALSSMVSRALKASDALSAKGIEAEIIDMRAIAPMDSDTVAESVKRTGRLLLLDDAPAAGGYTAELVARICEGVGPMVFKTAPKRLCPPLVPATHTRALHEELRVTPAKIVEAAQALMR